MTGLDQTIIVDNTNAMETVLEAKKAIEENNSKEAHRLLEKAMVSCILYFGQLQFSNNSKAYPELYIFCYRAMLKEIETCTLKRLSATRCSKTLIKCKKLLKKPPT